MSKALAVLEEAKAWLSVPEHWCKGTLGYLGPASCAVGAIKRVTKDWISAAAQPWLANNPAAVTAINRLHQAARQLNSSLKDLTFPAIHYNDARNTTHEDVINLYDTAIQLEKAAT